MSEKLVKCSVCNGEGKVRAEESIYCSKCPIDSCTGTKDRNAISCEEAFNKCSNCNGKGFIDEGSTKEEGDTDILCIACKTNMKLVSVDEGDMGTCWCPNCGTIWQGFEEEVNEQNYTRPKTLSLTH